MLIEFERGRPIIVDRALYRELVKGAIRRTHGDLEAKAATAAKEMQAARESKATADPVTVAKRARDAQLCELTDQAHGANLDLGHALVHNLAAVDPGDMNVARFCAVLCVDPHNCADELACLLELAPYLAEGTRRGLLIGEASDPEGPDAPGLLVLRADLSPESLTPGVARWLAELPDGAWEMQRLPSAVLAVARRALRSAGDVDAPGEIALARVMSQTGRWIMLHGAALVSDRSRRVAVIIEPAHPARIAPLLMAAYGLTEREQEVTRLVLQGASTAEIAERLFLSAHTVQDHLKSVFEKTDVRSRRELVGKVFFAYYEPRLRDNERRVTEGEPVRGDPLPSDAAT